MSELASTEASDVTCENDRPPRRFFFWPKPAGSKTENLAPSSYNMPGGFFLAGIVPFGKARNQSIGTHRVTSRAMPLKKGRGESSTKSHGAMSIFPQVPFPSGSWNVGEENRFSIGKRTRKRIEVASKEQHGKQSSARAVETDKSHKAPERTKRLGPALRKAQGRVSSLWKKRETQKNLFANSNTASSPLASEDVVVRSSSKSKNSKNSEIPQEHLSQSSNGETSSSNESSMGARFLKPLRNFRKRRFSRPYSSSGPGGEDIEIHLPVAHAEVTMETPHASPVSDLVVDDSCFAVFGPPETVAQPQAESTPADECEALSVLDLASTACIEPSVADMSTGPEEGTEAWEPPKRQKHKARKPRHGDDSVLIGMVITFDPTTELLEMGTEPQCVNRTMLGKLQQNDEYDDFLLGDRRDEEESSEELPSFSELLGFHLNAFALPQNMDTSMEEEPECPFPEGTLGVDRSFEIIFSEGEMSLDKIATSANYSRNQVDPEEEIEIVFSPIESSHKSDDEDNDDSSHDSGSKSSSEVMDCKSQESEGSALPLEWMLPETTPQLPGTKTMPSPSPTKSEACKDEAPDYEWFHPDHLDVRIVNQHTPRLLFIADGKPKLTWNTPSTMGETFSFDAFSCFDDGSGAPSAEVLSTVSAPSEAVQSLVEFCQCVL